LFHKWNALSTLRWRYWVTCWRERKSSAGRKVASIHVITIPCEPNTVHYAQGKPYFGNICPCINDIVQAGFEAFWTVLYIFLLALLRFSVLQCKLWINVQSPSFFLAEDCNQFWGIFQDIATNSTVSHTFFSVWPCQWMTAIKGVLWHKTPLIAQCLSVFFNRHRRLFLRFCQLQYAFWVWHYNAIVIIVSLWG